jgi:hypothetical protein
MAEDSSLRMAFDHVQAARRIVAVQRRRVAHLKAVGASTSEAERTLRIFESNVRIFEEHLALLRQALLRHR